MRILRNILLIRDMVIDSEILQEEIEKRRKGIWWNRTGHNPGRTLCRFHRICVPGHNNANISIWCIGIGNCVILYHRKHPIKPPCFQVLKRRMGKKPNAAGTVEDRSSLRLGDDLDFYPVCWSFWFRYKYKTIRQFDQI